MSDILSQWQDAQHEIDGLQAALSEAQQTISQLTGARDLLKRQIEDTEKALLERAAQVDKLDRITTLQRAMLTANGYHALEAQVAQLQTTISQRSKEIVLLRRLLTNDYLPWRSAWGPNKCKHGVAAGIACRQCDWDAALVHAQEKP